MKWHVLAGSEKGLAVSPEKLIKIILKNRGGVNIDEFLNPSNPYLLTPNHFKINQKNLNKAKRIIEKSIKLGEKIVVYGDYDVDGICATAIVWEALNKMGAKVLPFIPRRENEGYGLSKAGIDNIDAKLIIAVDSGIVAHEAIDYAHKKGIKVIVIDHHEKPKKLPSADAIIHTTELCSAGIAYFVVKGILDSGQNDALGLAAIATVCDMVPLVGANRSIVKYGLEELNKTARPGLKALLEVAGIKNVGTYEIGFMIGPRLNASGRIDSALTALRLLCTHDINKAHDWAQELNSINKERQTMMETSVTQAISHWSSVTRQEKIIVIDHESYHQGIIGLIAGKLTEKYYLPSIVISRGEEVSKASARSISGFNIIEAIRTTEKLLINAGGHPMAAGFTIKTAEIANFKLHIANYAKDKLSDDLLEKTLKIDCKIDLENICLGLYNELQKMAPFGLGNPEPIFCSDAEILNIRTMGAIGQHIKLTLSEGLEAVGFNMSHFALKLKAGDRISIAYVLDLNSYNGKTALQLKIKDIKLSHEFL